jgi:DNA-binding CsgD family transcriptional regulator
LEGFHRDAYPSDKLSQREIETLALVLVGFTLRMTSMIQGVTLGTIKKRWQLIKDKLGIGGKTRNLKELLFEWYETLNIHIHNYIKETIELQVALPFEFIDSWRQLQNAVDQQVRRLSGEPSSKPIQSKPVQQQQMLGAVEIAKALAQAIVNMELPSLFDSLVAVLDIQDLDQRDSLWSCFQRSIIHYLLQSIRPYLTIDITGLTDLLNEELASLSRPNQVPQLLEARQFHQ